MTPIMSVAGGRCCLETRFPLSSKPERSSGTGTSRVTGSDLEKVVRCSGGGADVRSPLLPLRRHTHELKLHQLLVRVCGWEQVKPVSVDKVGVFFRYAAADRNSSSNTVSPAQPPTPWPVLTPQWFWRFWRSLMCTSTSSPVSCSTGWKPHQQNQHHPPARLRTSLPPLTWF